MGGGEHDVIGIEDDAMRPIQPDARLDIEGVSGEVSLYVEYDRTRRVDKNYDKFRRYEAFLAGWWQGVLPEGSRRPAVVFVCQDAEHQKRFVDAGDWQLTAYWTCRRSRSTSAASTTRSSRRHAGSLRPPRAARSASSRSTIRSCTGFGTRALARRHLARDRRGPLLALRRRPARGRLRR
jgi:hypothetical protein